MPRQFDLYRRANGTYVVIMRSMNLLDGCSQPGWWRPLSRPIRKETKAGVCQPSNHLGDAHKVLAIEFPAAATERELGTYVTNVAHHERSTTSSASLDLLFTGV